MENNNITVKYNASDIQNIFTIINSMTVQGIGNAQAVVAITDILNNKIIKDETSQPDEAP